jgi:hypothetical protein
MYGALDNLYVKISKKNYSSWADEYVVLIRLAIIKATGTEEDVSEFFKSNMKYDAIRRIAVSDAIAKKDYSHAEKLCLEKLNQNENQDNYPPSEWWYLLFEIYNKSGDTEKEIQTASSLLFRYDIDYYSVLKELLTKKGVWKNEYPSLLESLEKSLPYYQFMKILSKEGEITRLLEEVQRHPQSVFDYEKQLVERFPAQTYALYLDVIRQQATEANNRIKYKKVCALIKKLFNLGGVSEAINGIAELKVKFLRRPAMLDELDSLTRKLEKKKK